MKRFSQKYLGIALILVLVMTLTSCLGILGSILGGVDTFFSFVERFGEEVLPENVVYGTANDLAVGFESGNIVAYWDYETTQEYKLNITKGSGSRAFVQSEEGDAIYFTNGRFDLKAAGYDYFDDLSLELYTKNEEGLFVDYVTCNYQKLKVLDYEKYTKSVGNNFHSIDFYIASRYELFEFFSYMIIFRPDAAFTKVKKEVYYLINQNAYIGYNFLSLYSEMTKEDAFDQEIACAIASFEDSAAYNYAYELTDDVASFKLKFYYVTDPTFSTNTFSTYTNAIRPTDPPHYKLEHKERTFAIDSRTNIATVASSDQLYFAIKKGYKPYCVPNSNAELIYNKMRSVLSSINADTHNAPTKVHYIYDYLVNTVLYDYDFIDVTLKDTAKNDAECFAYKCLYMEGVFGYNDKQFYDNQRVAICDGLSKAFLCMTQIEGIESIKVSGTVSGDAHAWNKVKIGTKWYLVDITWGNKLSGTKEYLSHEYLMVPDDSRHIEDKWYAYPKATGKYSFMFYSIG